MDKTLYILVGASGAGKTTWAANKVANTPKTVRVNRDELRRQISGLSILDDRYYERDDFNTLENRISDIVHEQTRYWILKGYNVILDNTNLRQKYIDEIITLYNHLIDIRIVPFLAEEHTDYKILSERVKLREGSEFDTGYIKIQLARLLNLDLTKTYYPRVYEKLEFDSGLPSAVICDLDGTLCLYGDKNPYDRDFENDIINEPILDMLQGMFCVGHHILFLSGRSSKFKAQTMQFLDDYFQNHSYTLMMREEGDNRKDYVVKEEMIRQIHKEEEWSILFSVDDRLGVIEQVWNKLGIFCYNVNQNNRRY
jgi:predicted kinase